MKSAALCMCFQVFVDQLTSGDLEFIADSVFPTIDKEIIAKMVDFSNRVGFLFFDSADWTDLDYLPFPLLFHSRLASPVLHV